MSHAFETGLVIGKFYPPHRGHNLLIDVAQRQSEQVTVIVCDRTGQAIPGELRARWLREMHPAVHVMVVEDVYPPDDSALWAALTVQWMGFAPEAVFTSEDYGARYATEMGATHVSVDSAREAVPCSATRIRADPYGSWDYLAPCVRAFYALRVCVVGAESTGSTTLAQGLAAHYHTEWVPEYGREYSEQHKFHEGATWSTDEFTHIALVQSDREDDAARRCNRVLVCDTDPLATAIWHERYMGTRSEAVEAIAAHRHYAQYLVTAPDIPFVQDGYRDGEHIRAWMHGRFLEELSALGRPFAVIEGEREQRLRTAVTYIDKLLTPNAS